MSIHLALPLLLQFAGPVPAFELAASPLKLELPWPPGETYRCSQGWHGKATHSNGVNDYAWDFALPEGTPVLAAASGRIVLLESYAQEARPPTGVTPYGNMVWIDHGGGDYTQYAHLRAFSAWLREGQLVNGGQFLGWSGNTGNSSGPHLHFCVTDVAWRSRPSRFTDVSGKGVPVAGRSYTSANDGEGTSWFQGDSALPPDLFAGAGITLTTSVPATFLDRDADYLIRGTLSPARGSVRMFFTRLGTPDAIDGRNAPLSTDRSGSFQLRLRPAEFSALFDAGGHLALGIAPIRGDGSYHTVILAPVVSYRRALDGQDRPLVPMGLPLPHGKPHDYCRIAARTDRVTEDVIAFQVAAGTPILAGAAGRVIAVGPSNERPESSTTDEDHTLHVLLDHGEGFTTDYGGIATSSLRVRAGQIVAGGAVLGTFDRGAQAAALGLTFTMHAQAGSAASPVFEELGADGFLSRGIVQARSDRAGEHVFRSDSTVGEETFAPNGVALAAGAPAHTFHEDTIYTITGEIAEPRARVAFLVRERGTGRNVVALAVAPQETRFRIVVRLAGRIPAAAVGPWEWAIAYADEGEPTAEQWEPLVVMR